MMTVKKNIKIIVALSGGVDSAVAAALLKKRGYEVVGVFFRFFDSPASEAQAKKIAKKLGIPLKIIDARKVFKKRIVGYFISSYEKGLTPNPCVVCNKEMKFRLLFDLIRKEKADYVATGHYACLRRELKNQKSKLKIREKFFYELMQAKDKQKDQSYFLYRLAQKELAKIIFPLGDLKKSEVKNMAVRLNLPVSKTESQDVCFLLGKGVDAFLKKHIRPKSGNIIDEKKNILGKHKGLPFYTVGQRKGIEIGGTGPFWVIRKNMRKNELLVTSDHRKLLVKKLEISKANWINQKIKFPLRARVQIRYRAGKFPAIIKSTKKPGRLAVETKKPLRAVTSGQSAVFYGGEEVIGGGIII